MIISAPPIEPEPDKPESEQKLHTWEEYRRVQIFLNVAPWYCKCNGKWTRGLKWHGRVLKCFYCGTPRPADYKKKP